MVDAVVVVGCCGGGGVDGPVGTGVGCGGYFCRWPRLLDLGLRGGVEISIRNETGEMLSTTEKEDARIKR